MLQGKGVKVGGFGSGLTRVLLQYTMLLGMDVKHGIAKEN